MPHQYKNVIDGELEEIVSLANDFDRWPDLMPHVTSVTGLKSDGESSVAIVRILLWRPLFYNLHCRTRVAEQDGEYRSQMHFTGRASGGLFQNWSFVRRDDDRVAVRVFPRVHSGRWSVRTRLFNRLVIDPFTVRLLDMIAMLTEADRLSRMGVVDDAFEAPLPTDSKSV